MMGRREGEQGQFFYSFDLDKVVPASSLFSSGRDCHIVWPSRLIQSD
jgi:hypothetical protein